MTKSEAFDFHLDRPGALIAAIPAVLGFVPEDSLVLITLAAGEMGAVIRADLADEVRAGLAQLAEVAASGDADAAVAVIVDADGLDCRLCSDDHRARAAALEKILQDSGIELLAVHVVDRVEAGGRWQCVDGCGNSGLVDDPSASPLAMAAVLDGRRLYAKRGDLLELIANVDGPRTEVIRREIGKLCATTDHRPRSDAEVRADVERVMAATGRASAGAAAPDAELAALARAVVDPRVRDTLYALAVGVRAADAEELWAALARTLPAPWRIEALVLLAFSAYARGDGPLAGVALDEALAIDDTHRMAGMLDTALRSGLRPDRIRELALTGYRLAERMGVQLPPRQLFGRSA
ncbi:hypothetical protein ABIA30_000494 [Mycobacterium sp. MAA66]|uniref:DUF4192 domain-containing protein n=1 Tax=Mycobacterium sp. MAA66 TaxID=3156297 RepID=UPI0035126204